MDGCFNYNQTKPGKLLTHTQSSMNQWWILAENKQAKEPFENYE